MYRFLVRLVVFTFIIGLSLYLGVQWKLKEDLRHITSVFGPIVTIEYQNSAMLLTGTVVVTDIELHFRQQDIDISIDKIEYSSGSILDMAFLRGQLNSKEYPDKLNLVIHEAVIPLTPSLVKFIGSAEQDSVWNALNASACGKVRHLGINEYFSMGYDYLVFSAESQFHRDDYSGNLVGEGWLDVEETTKFNYQFDVAGVYERDTDPLRRDTTPSVEFFEMNIEDKGYNRHRNEFCASKSNLSSEQFIEQHVKTIAEKLNSVGIKMTLTGQRFYRDSMLPDSLLRLSIRPQVSFTMADFGYYDEQELRKILGLELEINKQIVTGVFNNWALDKFEKIDIRDDSEQEAAAKQKRFENIIIKRNYRRETLQTVKNYLNYKVKVVRNDGKIFEGNLTQINNDRYYISMPVQSGTVEVRIESKLIEEIFVYR